MAASTDADADALLGFDGTVYRFDGGYEISLRIRRIEASPEFPHGFRYSSVLRGPATAGNVDRRILGYDNAHAPLDLKRPYHHVHRTRRGPGGAPIGVGGGVSTRTASIDELIGRFIDECWKELGNRGVDVGSIVEIGPRR